MKSQITSLKGNVCTSVESAHGFKKLLTAVAVLGASAMTVYNYPAHAAMQNNLTGEVERITVDNPFDRWSRGTIVVAGQNVIVPRNFVIDLPANRQTIQELFANAPSACADTNNDGIPDQTGLAKADKER